MIPGIIAGALPESGVGTTPVGTDTIWRFQAETMNLQGVFPSDYVGWVGIRAYDEFGSQINLVTGCTYAEGGAGSQGAHGASAPFDGNVGTYWLRSGAPSWVQVTTPAPISPARFEFQCESRGRSAVNFTIRRGAGGATLVGTVWEPSHDVANSSRSWPQDYSGGKHKAYGFYVTANNGDGFALMSEAELHATIGGADFLTGGFGAGSHFQTNAGGEKLFDNDVDTKVLHANPSQLPGWAMYGLPVPLAVPAEFSLTFKDGTLNRGWKDFSLFALDDGIIANRTTLKTIANEAWASSPLTKTYAVP